MLQIIRGIKSVFLLTKVVEIDFENMFKCFWFKPQSSRCTLGADSLKLFDAVINTKVLSARILVQVHYLLASLGTTLGVHKETPRSTIQDCSQTLD